MRVEAVTVQPIEHQPRRLGATGLRARKQFNGEIQVALKPLSFKRTKRREQIEAFRAAATYHPYLRPHLWRIAAVIVPHVERQGYVKRASLAHD